MGRDIITSAKDIIISQQNTEQKCVVIGDNENSVMKDVTIHYKALQAQVQSLEEKIELILRKLN